MYHIIYYIHNILYTIIYTCIHRCLSDHSLLNEWPLYRWHPPALAHTVGQSWQATFLLTLPASGSSGQDWLPKFGTPTSVSDRLESSPGSSVVLPGRQDAVIPSKLWGCLKWFGMDFGDDGFLGWFQNDFEMISEWFWDDFWIWDDFH